MDIETRVLECYLAVVREGNISRAAEVLHMTQPTLSRQMSDLEKRLGHQLFICGRHLQLTDAGVLLRRRAEEVHQLMDCLAMLCRQNGEVFGRQPIGHTDDDVSFFADMGTVDITSEKDE